MKVFKNEKFREFLVGLAFSIICFMLTGIIGAGATSLISSREVSYKNNTSGLDSENVQDAIDELWINNGCGNSDSDSGFLKVGDYVQMIPTLSSYTTESKYTGFDTPTINPQELNLWRVIRVNSDGTYDAVSEYVSSTNVPFWWEGGYKSFVGYLNILASKYENRNFTVGSRIMGYNGQTEFITDRSKFDGSSNIAPWTESTSGTPAEEYLGRGDELYTTDYDLVKAAYGGTDASYAKANKVGTTTATSYWLGSRFYYYNSSSFSFSGRNVNASGNVGYDDLCLYYDDIWNIAGDSRALRPIITLRSGLTATGSGTSADPYVLQ